VRHNKHNASIEPLVSILIPAFNAQEWIADTLRSAIAQTWNRKEIIVVDDGSTDQTLTIARRFESDSVRVITQHNQGASAARNKAFSLSHGQYIQWLDADDLLAPDKISQQLKVLDVNTSKRLLLSSAFGKFSHRYYKAKFLPTALWCNLSPVDWLVRKLGDNIFMQTATWLVSRELTEAAGPWNTELLGDDDGEYFCRVILESESIRFVPEAKLYYRSPIVGTLSQIGRSKEKLEAHWKSMQLHILYLRRLEESDRVRRACLAYLQTSFIYFYPELSAIVHEIELLATELGGRVFPPNLSWKYSWIRDIFGWKPAKRAQFFGPQMKCRFLKSWDELLFRLRMKFSPVQP
jgi:glycosyltransferase involved in cell wall biosynthesis